MPSAHPGRARIARLLSVDAVQVRTFSYTWHIAYHRFVPAL